MIVDKNFRFKVNVSKDYYEKKTDASACLSQKGAKAIGKEKMAFRVQDVNPEQFLWLATRGHAFCNLFAFDPNKEYWFETCNGQKYKTTPLYKREANQGCMKLEFKSDRFFYGAQTVFVDIDLTRFENIQDYLRCLTIQPTCVYMSYSDKLEKRGRISRRFRMVYVFDKILGKKDLNVVSWFITDSIVKDTGEPMEDDCGTRVSQYFNGVFGNIECYLSSAIYSRLDFPESLPQEVDECQVMPPVIDPSKPTIEFDRQMLQDMAMMDYDSFMHYYSCRYSYFYRTESDYWIDGKYQLTDDNYLQLWWYGDKVTDGNNRRRKLFMRACLRRLMRPNVDPDTLLFNMYVDFYRFIDNSDNVITLDMLKRRTERAMLIDEDGLRDLCDYEIGYWRDHRQKFILHPDVPHTQAYIRYIDKEVRYKEIDGLYDRSRSVRENAETLGIPLSSLYRYCSERGIDTNPDKGMTYNQQREAHRQAKADMRSQFMMLYDPNLSLGKNLTRMQQEGLELSKNTVRNWSMDYISPDELSQSSPQPIENDAVVLSNPFTVEPPPFISGMTDNGFGYNNDDWSLWYSHNGL